MPKTIDHALITFYNSFCHFFRSFTIVGHLNFCKSVNPHPHFTPYIWTIKQDLTPTNQNTRSRTHRHSTSCILVPRHDHTHGNHSRRLKSPIHSIFTVLDPLYPHHFAVLFGLPAVPYRGGGTQCSKTDFSVKMFAKSLKQGAPVVPRGHNSDHAGSVQNPTVFSPTVLPLNSFQSFVLHCSVAGGTTRPNNPAKKSVRPKKTSLNKDFSDQRMDTTDADSLVLQTKLQYLKYTQARPFMKPNVWLYRCRRLLIRLVV
jgi:hypothetical protein